MTVLVSWGDLLLLPVLIGYTLWWSYDLRKGARVRRWTLGLHIAVYGLAAFWVWLFSLDEITWAGGTDQVIWIWLLGLPLLLYLAARAGLRYGRRRITVYALGNTGLRYRGPVGIALFWFALYVIRLGLEDGLLGGFSVFFPIWTLPTGSPPDGLPIFTFASVVLVVACLYLLSFGFLLGITLAVWGHRRRAVHAVAAGGPPRIVESAAPPPPAPPRPAIRPSGPAVPSAGRAGPTTSPRARTARSSPSRFCTNCGRIFGYEGGFCTGCGAAR